MDQFLITETLIIQLLVMIAMVAMIVRRVKVPYTVALVIAGLFVTFQHPFELELTPDMILALFVPPLIFEASFHIEIKRLRDHLFPILVLAAPGVLLTAVMVAFIVAAGVQIPLPVALVFGALISATDPVAVIALFRSLGAPKSLEMLIDGESILNDGTAAVLFHVMLGFAAAALVSEAGAGGDESASLLSGFMDFVWVSAIGTGIGLGLGWLISKLVAGIDDHLIITTLTTALPFGAYILAEQVHVSGILAVFGAGLMFGNLGVPATSPTTRVAMFNFWEFLTFIVNSMVFLLIGLEVRLPEIIDNAWPIGVAIVAVLLSRVVTVYGLCWLSNWITRVASAARFTALTNWSKINISWAYQHVMFWGGLRGGVALALALSLDPSFPNSDLIHVMTFGVVLFTLLVQAMTMGPLLFRLGLIEHDEDKLEHERRRGRLMAARASRGHLEQLHREGLIADPVWEQLSPYLNSQIQERAAAQLAVLQQQPNLISEEYEHAWREGLRAQRAVLKSLASDGMISEHVYEELVQEIDESLDDHHHQEAEAPQPASPHQKSLFQLAMETARSGNKEQARNLFRLLTTREPANIQAWLWLAGLTKESPDEYRAALEQVVALEPGNELAIKALHALDTQPTNNGNAESIAATIRQAASGRHSPST
jgi:CPA1 family monovalent cation:H+ antiporter